MAKKPVLEDVIDDDIDNMDMDIAQFDPSLITPIAPLRPEPSVVRSQDEADLSASSKLAAGNVPPLPRQESQAQKGIFDTNKFSDEDRQKIKKFQIIYPCYFDKNRSHREGRRIAEDKAVENPLAKTISDACRLLKIPVLLELDKTHPQDFGNPGRVRVMLRNPDDGSLSNGRFQSKRALFDAIAEYLQSHPTTLKSIGPGSGLPIPGEYENGFEPKEIPKVKGFRMNTIAPVHSELTIGHPMTKSIYDPEPEERQSTTPQLPKQPKKKIMKIRG
ncbi:uncharacterized protein PRCAT00004601001 [Priceomyces carsonii]|uniref:uncharacterized protein n=1 Tax=Priceomyces carsonii TaxID=28549 RepID=UPI002EDA045A|nr:unnamed protein product [Priceomyces carsonii]